MRSLILPNIRGHCVTRLRTGAALERRQGADTRSCSISRATRTGEKATATSLETRIARQGTLSRKRYRHALVVGSRHRPGYSRRHARKGVYPWYRAARAGATGLRRPTSLPAWRHDHFEAAGPTTFTVLLPITSGLRNMKPVWIMTTTARYAGCTKGLTRETLRSRRLLRDEALARSARDAQCGQRIRIPASRVSTIASRRSSVFRTCPSHHDRVFG